MKPNMTNFRVFGPDETTSNKLDAIYEVSQEILDRRVLPRGRRRRRTRRRRPRDGDAQRAHPGRHAGGLPAHRPARLLLDLRSVRARDRLDVQPARQVAGDRNQLSWRQDIASLNLLITSTVWRQDHNGFTHQDPGFLDVVVNKSASVTRIYLPPDANCLLSVADHCLRSDELRQRDRLPTSSLHLQYLDMDAAIEHCTKGIGIWDWASNDSGQRARRGDGLGRRHPDAGGPGRHRPAPRGVPRPEDPLRQRGRPVQSASQHASTRTD